MGRILGWLVVGAVVGIVATIWTTPSGTRLNSAESASEPAVAARVDNRGIDALESRVARLESLIDRLIEENESLRLQAAPTGASASREMPAPTREDLRSIADSLRSASAVTATRTPEDADLVERLVAGGFSQARADQIKRLSDEMTMRAIEARFDVERNGTDPSSYPALSSGFGPALREEIGDAEYAQYLRATGVEPGAQVLTVIDNSPASLSGLREADRIVAYGGTAVFDFTEVTPLAAQGTPGEPVIVDIVRDGQAMQIVVPRGPLGVRLGSDVPIAFRSIGQTQ